MLAASSDGLAFTTSCSSMADDKLHHHPHHPTISSNNNNKLLLAPSSRNKINKSKGSSGGGGGGAGSNKRRFSDEQIKSLELIFENESKLEPRKKVEVARDLGLQPRQVAIWFQNKRARWKSKQLEVEYGVLKASYDGLAARFDCLRKEKHSLVEQLEKLKKGARDNHQIQQKQQQDGKRSCCNRTDSNDRESKSNNNAAAKSNALKDRSTDEDEEVEEEDDEEVKSGTRLSTTAMEKNSYELAAAAAAAEATSGVFLSEDDESNYLGMEETEMDLLTMVEPACSSLTSDEDWHGLQSDGLFDQSACSSEWWDFWS